MHHLLSWIGWRGRLRRSTFWLVLVITSAVFVILFMALQTVAGYASTLALYPPFFMVLLALMVRRLHDRHGYPRYSVNTPGRPERSSTYSITDREDVSVFLWDQDPQANVDEDAGKRSREDRHQHVNDPCQRRVEAEIIG